MNFEQKISPDKSGAFEKPQEAKESMAEKVSKLEKEQNLEKEPSPAMEKHRNWAERATRWTLGIASKKELRKAMLIGGAYLTGASLVFAGTLNMPSYAANALEINQLIGISILTGVATGFGLAGSKIAEKIVQRKEDLPRNLKYEEMDLTENIEDNNSVIERSRSALESIKKNEKTPEDVKWDQRYIKYYDREIKIAEKKISINEKKLARIRAKLEKLNQAA